jgi:hypothetical protein
MTMGISIHPRAVNPNVEPTMSMKERDRQRFLERQAEQRRQREARQPAHPRRSRNASRAEQHARYLEVGPLAWDDRDNPDY